MNKDELENSILIVIEPNGQHHIRIPSDESLEFSAKAYSNMVNTMTVLGQPSYLLLAILWAERKIQTLCNQFTHPKKP